MILKRHIEGLHILFANYQCFGSNTFANTQTRIFGKRQVNYDYFLMGNYPSVPNQERFSVIYSIGHSIHNFCTLYRNIFFKFCIKICCKDRLLRPECVARRPVDVRGYSSASADTAATFLVESVML